MRYKTIKMTTLPKVALFCLLNETDEENRKLDDVQLIAMLDSAEVFLQKVTLENEGRNIKDFIQPIIDYFSLINTDPNKAVLELQLVVGDVLKEALRRKLPIAEHISFTHVEVVGKGAVVAVGKGAVDVKSVRNEDFKNVKEARVRLLPPERYKCYTCPLFTLVKKTCECGHSMCDKHFSTQHGKITCSACAHCLMNELEPLPDDWNIKCDTCEKFVCDKHSNNNGSGQTICAKCNPVLNAKQTASSPPPIASRPKKQVKVDKERQQQMKAEADAQQASDRLAQIEQLKKKQQEAEARELAQEKFKEEKHPKKRKRGGN
jgi:hypothetical protein